MKKALRIVPQTLCLLLFFLAGKAVHAQTSYTWNGSISTDWNTSGNWTPNGVPGTADNVTIVTGSNTGLGAGMAVALAEAGCDIVGVSRADAGATAARVEAAGRRFAEIDEYVGLAILGRLREVEG